MTALRTAAVVAVGSAQRPGASGAGSILPGHGTPRSRGALGSVRGLTLLETMVALVILGLVVLGYLEVFAGTARAQRNTDAWTQAVTYAEDGMELAKLDLQTMVARGREELEGGFGRQVTSRSLSPGLQLVTVTVFFPDGGRFVLDRLMEYP